MAGNNSFRCVRLSISLVCLTVRHKLCKILWTQLIQFYLDFANLQVFVKFWFWCNMEFPIWEIIYDLLLLSKWRFGLINCIGRISLLDMKMMVCFKNPYHFSLNISQTPNFSKPWRLRCNDASSAILSGLHWLFRWNCSSEKETNF